MQAAVAYSTKKASHLDTRSKCELAGMAFEPIVLEAQRGIEPRAAPILHRIARALAAAESADVNAVKAQMLPRPAGHHNCAGDDGCGAEEASPCSDAQSCKAGAGSYDIPTS